MNYTWHWGVFSEPSPEGVGSYADLLLSGLGWTVVTALASWTIAFGLGSVVGVARTLPVRAARAAGTAYVELFRNVPLLVQMFLWYFVLPELLPEHLGTALKQMPDAAFYTAVICLGFFTAARVAEQVRAGIEALPRGQRMAGTALGLTTAQTYRHVLLPNAYRIILPPLTSEFLNNLKNTSVALTIGLLELTARAHTMQESTFRVFEAFTAATLLYVLLNLIVIGAATLLERAVAIPGQR